MKWNKYCQIHPKDLQTVLVSPDEKYINRFLVATYCQTTSTWNIQFEEERCVFSLEISCRPLDLWCEIEVPNFLEFHRKI